MERIRCRLPLSHCLTRSVVCPVMSWQLTGRQIASGTTRVAVPILVAIKRKSPRACCEQTGGLIELEGSSICQILPWRRLPGVTSPG